MNHEELTAFFEARFEHMLKVMQAKNADYAGKNQPDAFKNFTLVEHMGGATVEQGFFTRMTDKFSRIASFVSRGELEVKEEAVTDTLEDLATYCILFMAYLSQKKSEPKGFHRKPTPIELPQ